MELNSENLYYRDNCFRIYNCNDISYIFLYSIIQYGSYFNDINDILKTENNILCIDNYNYIISNLLLFTPKINFIFYKNKLLIKKDHKWKLLHYLF